MLKISIVILNWNGGAEDCIEAVQSALTQSYPNKEIIFVDNGSTDGSGRAINERFSNHITYVALPQNIGCPAGRNEGAQYATGDIVAFLENDGAWKEHRVLGRITEFFEHNERAAALGIAVSGYHSNLLDAAPDGVQADGLEPVRVSSFRGGASFIRLHDFREVGGFPADFFRQGEERFVSALFYEKGLDVYYWGSPELRHKGSDYKGKGQQIRYFTFQTTMKTIIRLYPLKKLLLAVPARLLVNLLRFFRSGEMRSYIRVIGELPAIFISRKDSPQISDSTLNEIDGLRYRYKS